MTNKTPRTNDPDDNKRWQSTFAENQKNKGLVVFKKWVSPENKIRLIEYAEQLEIAYPANPPK